MLTGTVLPLPLARRQEELPPIATLPEATEQVAEGLTLAQATDFLDWLENRGVAASDVVFSPDGLVTIRW